MEARQPFSRLGWALFAQMAVMLAAQWGCCFWPGRHGPACWESRCFCGRRPSWGLRAGDSRRLSGAVGDGGPPAPARRPLGRSLRGPLGRLRGAGLSGEWGYPAPHRPAGAAPGARRWSTGGVHRPHPLPLQLLLAGLIAPAAEELLFRRLLLRRLRPYGGRFALVASALCFGLFHGNLNQFFMPFFWGWCWQSWRSPPAACGRLSSSTRWSTSFPSSGAGWAARWW